MKFIRAVLCLLLLPVTLPAADNVYLELTIDGLAVIGESPVASLGRADTIVCFSFTHELHQPRDVATGLPTGKRQHGPITITKPIDRSSPLLFKALAHNEAVTAAFRFYRPNPSGAGDEEHYYTVYIAPAVISTIRTISPDSQSPETAPRPAMEEVSFVYDQVTWTYAIGGATHTDSRPAQLPPAPDP